MPSGNMDYTRWNSEDRDGSPPPPRYDSNGKKVPIWEAVEIDICNDEKKPFEKQPSWKSLISRASSWGSIRSNPMERKRNWKPVTLRFPILGSIFAVTVAMIIGLEVLSYTSIGSNNANGGGLAFAATVDDISTVATASYLYLPTAIAVIYSMLWSWVDLDTKRLEPWFQLSKPNGAVAEDSILLQYPFDFLAFVPIRAARHKHWAVVVAGTTMIIITWAVVPLQSAIFSTGIVARTTPSQMVTTMEPMPISDQTNTLNSKFLNTAYGISWLGQKLPAYTTKEYALLPFKPAGNTTEMTGSETWSAETELYYTNLTCTPAKVSKGYPFGTFIFDNLHGCSVSQIGLPNALGGGYDNMLLYIQYYSDAYTDYNIANSNCTKEHSHNFLALWGSAKGQIDLDKFGSGQYGDLTALFCQPTYHVRTVNAAVNASDHAVVGVSYDDESQARTLPSEVFNVTNFEYKIGTGVSATGGIITATDDLPNVSIVEQFPRLLNYSLIWPVTNMVGFAMAASSGHPEDFSNPLELHNAFEKAHKLLFSMAINSLMLPAVDPSAIHERQGVLADQPGAIILVRSFAIVVEAFLAVVCILTCVLWLYSQERQSNMTSDPASISDVMKLVRNSKGLLHDFNDNGTVTGELLKERIKGHRFRLPSSMKNDMQEMHLEALGKEHHGGECDASSQATPQGSIDCPEQFQAVRAFELTFIAGSLMAVMIAMAIGVLIFLYDRIQKLNGLIRPSEDPLVLSILENFLPTAFATLIEPLWVILNRLLCILQPFDDLRNGNAKSRATVEAKYTSLPPQLVIWRAIRSRHFFLALICIVSISSNALAVALSGLFNESVTQVIIPVGTTTSFTPAFNGTPSMDQGSAEKRSGYIITYLDHYYVALANLTSGAPLPPWVDNSYFYLPFEIPDSSLSDSSKRISQVVGFNTTTRGFGLDVQCKEISTQGNGDTVFFRPIKSGTDVQLFISHQLEGGGNITCFSKDIGYDNGIRINVGPWANDTSALEVVSAMRLSNETIFSEYTDNYCNSLLLAGWVRLGPADLRTETVSNNITDGRLMETTFMTCSPTFRTAMFDIRVDDTGRILSSNRSSDFDTDLSPYGSKEAITRLVQETSILANPYSPLGFRWHTNSFTTDWMNSLLKAKLGTSDLVNPAAPLPNVTMLVPHMEDLYQRLFPIVLSLNTTAFANSPAPVEMHASIIAMETRIFMSPVMFYISVIVLIIHLFAVAAYYARRPKRFLPRMPLTIASIISFVSASHVIQDYNRSGWQPKDVRYGYGRFKGMDNKTHVGIEKAPLVVPLKSENPDAKRRKWAWNRKKYDPMEPRIWI